MNLNHSYNKLNSDHKAVIIIPARLNSSRLDKKLLLKTGNQTLLEQTISNAIQATKHSPSLIEDVILTSDNSALLDEYSHLSSTFLSKESHMNGSSRVLEAWKSKRNHYDQHPDFLINLQGDQPAFHQDHLLKMIQVLIDNPEIQALTPVMSPLNSSDKLLSDPNNVKALVNPEGEIIDFSRDLDYLQVLQNIHDQSQIMFHAGVYAYRSGVFQEIHFDSPVPRAINESLEQLTVMERNCTFHALPVPYDEILLGIDTQSDYERFLKSRYPDEIPS